MTTYCKRRRCILITGGATGIGKAILQRFAKEDWNIICHYHSSSYEISKLAEEISHTSVKLDLIHTDLATEEGINLLIEKIEGKEIDTLINNAGAYIYQRHFSELKLSELSHSFLLNLAAPFSIASAVFGGMNVRKFGRIVNISSIAAKYGGSASSMHYGCFKRGVEGIARTLSREGAHNGVLVNNVRPGVIDTSFHTKFPKEMQARINMIPARRIGTVQEVAELVYYLGSETNSFITGQTFTISGGE